ncbi:MAG: WYL domain-containing protein [Lachnospiraceae bacterium]|nr:WYL domain-containing protein [Lachnospiraceae bacterium]
MAKNFGTAENTRNYTLFVLLTLQKHSDRSHPLSITEVCESLNSHYLTGRALDRQIDRSTVSRILADMETIGGDFPVKCVMNRGTSDTPSYAPYEDSNTGKSKKKFYYYDQPFPEEQILTMRDAIEAYNHFCMDDITIIIDNLIRICPDSYSIDRYINREDKDIKEPDSSRVLRFIKQLNDIIKTGGFAKIEYCNYGIDGKLHLREGYPKLFRPFRLLWGNGFYYCACMKDDLDTPVSLRIDRMTRVSPVSPKDVDPKTARKFPPVKDVIPSKSSYRLKHPVMFGGKVIKAKFLIRTDDKNGMINAVVDTFGRNSKMRELSEAEIEMEKLPQGDDWILAEVEGSFGGLVLFATQYCQNIKVKSPENVAEETKKRMKESLGLYE